MPEPTLPPFAKQVENEPYSDTNSFGSKFSEDVVLDKLNDLAEQSYKMGESLFKRISQSEFFSSRSSQEYDVVDDHQTKNHQSQTDKH